MDNSQLENLPNGDAKMMKEQYEANMGDDGTSKGDADREDEDNLSYSETLDDKNDNDVNPELDFSSLTLNNIGFSNDRAGYAQADTLLPEPPDGGYGWVIVMAAFFSNLIVDGTSNSFGAFIIVYQEYFKQSKAAVSLVGSLLIGCYLLVGPVAGGLVNKYGARRVVIVGSIIASIAFAASIVSTNIYIFMMFYGVLGGVGYGLIFLPAIVTVSYYFESKRSVATGIALAGSGVGTFIMPQICVQLINHYGWQITVCVLSGFNLLCGIFGFLYRPLQTKISDDIEKNMKECEIEPRPTELLLDGTESPTRRPLRSLTSMTNGDLIDGIPSGMEPEAFARLRSALSECENDEENIPTPVRPPLSPINEGKIPNKNRTESVLYSHAERAYSLSTRTRKLTLTSAGSEVTSVQDLKNRLAGSRQLSRISVRSYAQSMNRLNQLNQLKGAQSLASVSSVNPKEFKRPMNRRDIFYTGSIKNLPEFEDEGRNYRSYRESQICVPAAVASQALSNASQAGDIADIQSRIGGSRLSRMTGGIGPEEEELLDFYDDSKFKFLPLSIRNALSEMIDVALLKEPVMMLLCISNLISMLGFYVPFMFIIDMAIEKKISAEQSSFLLSIIGIANTFGRIVFGWVSDRGWISALTITNVSLVICGLLTGFCPFSQAFLPLALYAALFGFIISAYISLTSIVLADLLGLERLTNSFGLLVVSRGIASLVGTPLAGIVYDMTSSYDATFFFAGGLILLSGAVSCLIPTFHRRRRNKIAFETTDAFTVDETRDAADDAQSGKLSVLTEHSEENLTEYQRTIQSLRQQQKLLQEYEEERKRIQMNNKANKPQTVVENEEENAV